jgi:hypothetical protein
MRPSFWVKRILLFIVIAPLAILVFGGVVMLLWNNVLSPVLHISIITFWQALGILVLSKILFGSFSGGRGMHRSGWRQRMQEKWARMTPEEREKYKEKLKNRYWGWRADDGPQTTDH